MATQYKACQIEHILKFNESIYRNVRHISWDAYYLHWWDPLGNFCQKYLMIFTKMLNTRKITALGVYEIVPNLFPSVNMLLRDVL